jgi:hypothetical protein
VRIRTLFPAAVAAATISFGVMVGSAQAAPLPSGCTLTVQTPYVSSTVIKGSSGGSCLSSGTTRTLYGELWHDYNFVPDVRVVRAGDTGKKRSYRASFSVCDNGGTTIYYTKGLFAGYSYYLDSAKATVAHC